MQKRKSLKRKVGIFNKRRKDFHKRSVPYDYIITLKDHNGETKSYILQLKQMYGIIYIIEIKTKKA